MVECYGFIFLVLKIIKDGAVWLVKFANVQRVWVKSVLVCLQTYQTDIIEILRESKVNGISVRRLLYSLPTVALRTVAGCCPRAYGTALESVRVPYGYRQALRQAGTTVLH